jgi:hypothetical protein
MGPDVDSSLMGCLVSNGGHADELSGRRAEALQGAADIHLVGLEV